MGGVYPKLQTQSNNLMMAEAALFSVHMLEYIQVSIAFCYIKTAELP